MDIGMSALVYAEVMQKKEKEKVEKTPNQTTNSVKGLRKI